MLYTKGEKNAKFGEHMVPTPVIHDGLYGRIDHHTDDPLPVPTHSNGPRAGCAALRRVRKYQPPADGVQVPHRSALGSVPHPLPARAAAGLHYFRSHFKLRVSALPQPQPDHLPGTVLPLLVFPDLGRGHDGRPHRCPSGGECQVDSEPEGAHRDQFVDVSRSVLGRFVRLALRNRV